MQASTFRLHYEFASKLLEKLVGPVFGYIANTMVDAFVKRAEQLYGNEARSTRRRGRVCGTPRADRDRAACPSGTTVARRSSRSGVAREVPRPAISREAPIEAGIFGRRVSLETRACAPATAWRSIGRSWPSRRKRGASEREGRRSPPARASPPHEQKKPTVSPRNRPSFVTCQLANTTLFTRAPATLPFSATCTLGRCYLLRIVGIGEKARAHPCPGSRRFSDRCPACRRS